jgi:hypothetical protein
MEALGCMIMFGWQRYAVGSYYPPEEWEFEHEWARYECYAQLKVVN